VPGVANYFTQDEVRPLGLGCRDSFPFASVSVGRIPQFLINYPLLNWVPAISATLANIAIT
jgi:hypothetical protein